MMASSEGTVWEKVEHPSTTSPKRSQSLPQPDDEGLAREERSSSSTISGRPAQDQRLVKSFKIVHRRRDKLVERRVKLVRQRTEHEHQRNAVMTSNDRIFEAVETFLSRYAINRSSSPEYLAIQGSLQESKDRARILESMEIKLQETTRNVNSKEDELFVKEKKVYKRLATLTGLTTHPQPREQPQPTRSTSSKSTTQTHPRARKYYDRAGQVKNLRDKIHNIQVQHQQDLASRQARRESGHSTKLPERLFHERFYEKLASILEELERAKKDAFLLKLACERQGIVLEDEVEPHRDQDDYDYLMLKNDRVILPKLGGNPVSRNSSFLLDELLSGYNDTTTKTRRWLNGIPRNTQEMVDPLSPDDSRPIESDINIMVALDSPSFGPAVTDVPAPVEKRIAAGFHAQQSRKSFTIEDPDAEAIETASVLSAGPPTSSDREFLHDDFVREAPMRRYSDPNPGLAYWLRPASAQKVLKLSQGNEGRRSRRNSH